VLEDPAVTDVFVTGDSGTWVDRGGGARPEPRVHLSEAIVRDLAVRLVARGGRHVDEASPCVDVRLPGGVRVHAVLPPVSTLGTALSIRFPRAEPLTLDDLSRTGFFADVDEGVVRSCVDRRANVLVTGAGGTGKTTFLAAMLSAASPGDRIVTVEDVAELRVRHPHVVSLEARQPNLEGAGGIDLARLLREALRMRPDRLVVGECRGVEVRELLSALNTGHDGGAGTLHANGLADVPARLEALGAVAGLGPTALARQAVSALDAVFHVDRVGGRRRLACIGSLGTSSTGELIAREGLGGGRGRSMP
jgi:pilus assembly protein CpaF